MRIEYLSPRLNICQLSHKLVLKLEFEYLLIGNIYKRCHTQKYDKGFKKIYRNIFRGNLRSVDQNPVFVFLVIRFYIDV